MNDELPGQRLQVAMEKRVLNEFGAKILNEERLEKGIKSRREERLLQFTDMLLSWECDASACTETMSMPTRRPGIS